MVILGLGSNLGDRLAHLRLAYRFLKEVPCFVIQQVSPVYVSDALLPENAPPSWNVPYLNLALRCETTLTPYELLTYVKQIEIKAGRMPEKDWGPRVIDIDILAWDDFIQYDEKLHIPHENLHERPFALWPLADVAPFWAYPLEGSFQGKIACEMVAAWGSRFDGKAPFHTRQIQQRIDTPQLVGILNLTPDSFSDAGNFTTVDQALHHIQRLVTDGAEIIDIGAEATGPSAQPIDHVTEWRRLETVLHGLRTLECLISPKISIDTRHVETARKALDLEVDWINDVSGLDDPAMIELMNHYPHDVVVMHHKGIPVSQNQWIPHQEDVVNHVYRWAEKKITLLEKQGIPRKRIIFDVGIGYGNHAEQAVALLNRIHSFQSLNTRLLIGHSRKSFLSLFTSAVAGDRDIETMMVSLHLIHHIDYLRIHNADIHSRAFKLAKTFASTIA